MVFRQGVAPPSAPPPLPSSSSTSGPTAGCASNGFGLLPLPVHQQTLQFPSAMDRHSATVRGKAPSGTIRFRPRKLMHSANRYAPLVVPQRLSVFICLSVCLSVCLCVPHLCSVNLSLPPSLPPSLPLSLSLCVCVCVCVLYGYVVHYFPHEVCVCRPAWHLVGTTRAPPWIYYGRVEGDGARYTYAVHSLADRKTSRTAKGPLGVSPTAFLASFLFRGSQHVCM